MKPRFGFEAALKTQSDELTQLAIRSKRHWGYSQDQIDAWTPGLTVTPQFIEQHTVFSCQVADHIVAFYALVPIADDELELEHCWVDPEHMGRGIGRTLIDHVRSQMQQAQVTKLRIVSDPNAVEFYEKMGAVRVSTHLSSESGRELPLLYLLLE